MGRHSGRSRGSATVADPGAAPQWQIQGQRHSGDPGAAPQWRSRGSATVADPGAAPQWQIQGQRHSGDPGAAPQWRSRGSATVAIQGQRHSSRSRRDDPSVFFRIFRRSRIKNNSSIMKAFFNRVLHVIKPRDGQRNI